MTLKEFNQYFSKYFTESQNQKLRSTIGLKGQVAKNAVSRVRGIELSWQNAYEAFVEWTLPKFWNLTKNLWPGIELLCESAQIALVSIVFNRGASTKGNSRREMLNIKPLVLRHDYKGIAEQVRSMKRLWIGKNLDGLIRRRDIEAQMIEKCN